MATDSKKHGAEGRWLGLILWSLTFACLEMIAVWAALRRLYGVSIALGGVVGTILALSALKVLAAIGM